MKQAFNPYLPSYEYVPDGEPHVFGDRVYVYGSHDRFKAPVFCVNDYVCWSAPVDDLADWRYEGIIYRKTQDPANPLGIRCLYAPDVTRGPDGRYYLYYAFDLMGQIGVAVCDTPAGQYEYLGKVRFADGHVWGTRSGEPFPFDPGVLTDDDGRVYLYAGFAVKVPRIASRFHDLTNEGGVMAELEPDMLTIRSGPKLLFPARGREGAFENHAFFEASSIRRVDGKYCFIYSSEHNHELCYAMGDSPYGPFVFGGTLVDQGDLFLDHDDERHAANYLGNTHGSISEINGVWYVFYHRQTNRSSFARQACAERLVRTADGFVQARVTSCGLNRGPLAGLGRYEARIVCCLSSAEGTYRYDAFDRMKVLKKHPYFTQSGSDREKDGDQYIANMRHGAYAGFRYFQLGEADLIAVDLHGKGSGFILVTDDEAMKEQCALIPFSLKKGTGRFTAAFRSGTGIRPLYFTMLGDGCIDFLAFELQKKNDNYTCGITNQS